MARDTLPVFISGLPPGMKVGIFDSRKSKSDPDYAILLREATEEDRFIVHDEIDSSYAGVVVNVIIRSAGFLPIVFETEIDPELGLLHAARLEVDRLVSGAKEEVPAEWDSDQQHREAQVAVQRFQRHRLEALYRAG